MAKARKTLVSIETDVWWVIGTRPNGKYFRVTDKSGDLYNLENATSYSTERAAYSALSLTVPISLQQKLHVIRISRTTRESTEDRT